MSNRTASAALGVLTLLALALTTGCSADWVGPSLGIFNYPIPVSPFVQDRMEDNFIWRERYSRMPIMGPITPGAPTAALDPPSEDEVMRTMERARPVKGGWPMLHEIQRNNVRIVVEPIADYIDPQPRHLPLVGPVQVHHAQYKCIVYFTEVTRVGWPIPYTTTDEDCQEVVYIDHSHLHMVGNVDPGPGSGYPETGR
jgi:hypothetical protein